MDNLTLLYEHIYGLFRQRDMYILAQASPEVILFFTGSLCKGFWFEKHPSNGRLRSRWPPSTTPKERPLMIPGSE